MRYIKRSIDTFWSIRGAVYLKGFGLARSDKHGHLELNGMRYQYSHREIPIRLRSR